jgi:UDP-3-O-[3-hydroxymyristoyl] N-acetylglucosamine deacetylase
MSINQKTLKGKVVFEGISVHSGMPGIVTLWPAEANSGIIFKNHNCPDDLIHVGTVVPEVAMHATVVRAKTWAISTVEHLMAAIWVLGLDNVVIEFDCQEVPIFDGSALPFVQGLLAEGFVEQDSLKKFLTPLHEVVLQDEKGRAIKIKPAILDEIGNYSRQLFVDYTLDMSNPLVGNTRFVAEIKQDFFVKEIAPARTFGFLEQLPFLRQHGLAQGTNLGNTLVIGADELLNEPRFVDECVRHKVLDLLGDLSLLGKNLAGSIEAHKTGHAFNRLVVEHFAKNPELWILI